MGLQVWLPLDGNINNQGLTPVTLSVGSPTYTSGKIGQCLNTTLAFNVSNNLITNLGSTNTYTMCCWCKNLNASASSRWVFSISSGTGTQRGLWENNSTTARHWAYSGSGVNLSTSINTIDGNWHHICFTSAGSVVKLYVDGIYQSQVTSASTTAMTTNIITLNANNYNLNDFRLYDTVLSPREIKEISKGLVLHYPLAMPGQENLVTGSNTNSTSTNKWIGLSAVGGNTSTIEVDETGTNCVKVTRDSTTQSSWDFLSYDALLRNQLKTDTTYTVSFDAKPSVDGTITLNGFMNGNATNKMTASVVQVQSSLLANKWNHCVYHCTTLDSFDEITISGQVVYLSRSTSLKGVNTTVLFKNIKVEEGEIATPWIPATSDALYSQMGLDNNIEYDVSGYGHNGTKVGTITYDADTPRYNTSAYFNGSSDIRSAKSSFGWFDFKEGTVAAWFKPANTTQTWASVGVQNDGGTGSRSFSVCNYSGKAATVVGYDSSWGNQSSDYSMAANTWYHLCATITNGDTVKLYVNGELVQTRTVTNTTGTIASTTQFAVGVDLPGSDERFTGQLSDVRFYTTCLSASDILELYHTPETLSNNGTLLTQGELVES